MIRDTSGQDRPLAKADVARPWRRWTRLVPTAIVVVATILAVGYVVRGWLAADASIDRARIRVGRVERGTLVRDVVSDGKVVAANSPTLYAVAAGTVEFHVRPGDAVKRGQKLATLTSPELHSHLAQEQATLAGLEGAVGRGKLDVDHGRANAQKLIAQADIDRQGAAREVEINEQMFSRGVIPELELRRSQDALKKAEIAAAHARTEAGLLTRELAFELATKQQGLDRQREIVRELARQVAALVIESPVDGQVGQLLVAQRAAVAANAPVINVVDLSAFELELEVADSFARDLAPGMAAQIRSGERQFAARVRSISPEVVGGNVATRLEFVDRTTPAQPGTREQTARPEGLRQNQRLSARIVIEEKTNVLKVERGPFVETGGGHSAYVVVDGVAERRAIRTGSLSIDAVEIVTGLSAGDEVVITGADAFRGAERVRIHE